jgi:hypothetical protein
MQSHVWKSAQSLGHQSPAMQIYDINNNEIT